MRYLRISLVQGWILLLCLCGLSLSLATARVLQGLALFTPEEAQQLRVTDQDVAPQVFTRALDSGPRIIIQRPKVMDTGGEAVIEVTGCRNPCAQLNAVDERLLAQVAQQGADGEIIRKAGIMAIVVKGGTVRPGDAIRVEVPAGVSGRLEPI